MVDAPPTPRHSSRLTYFSLNLFLEHRAARLGSVGRSVGTAGGQLKCSWFQGLFHSLTPLSASSNFSCLPSFNFTFTFSSLGCLAHNFKPRNTSAAGGWLGLQSDHPGAISLSLSFSIHPPSDARKASRNVGCTSLRVWRRVIVDGMNLMTMMVMMMFDAASSSTLRYRSLRDSV